MTFFGIKSSAPKEPSKLRFSIKAGIDKAASSTPSVSPTTPTSPKDVKAEVLLIVVSELPSEMFTVPRRMTREGGNSEELRVKNGIRGFGEDDIPMDDDCKLSLVARLLISHETRH
jgi:hypothetical protein